MRKVRVDVAIPQPWQVAHGGRLVQWRRGIWDWEDDVFYVAATSRLPGH